jgi:hypothetical protein
METDREGVIMNLEKLKKANDLRNKIEYLEEKIDAITEIKEQAASACSIVGLNLDFFNVKQVSQSSLRVSEDEMKFIINYIIGCWQKRKNDLETEFEQL